LPLAAFNDSPSIVECLRAEQAAANDDGQAILYSGETLKACGLTPHWNRIDFKAFRLRQIPYMLSGVPQQTVHERGLSCHFT
jgi:hypothetical protein